MGTATTIIIIAALLLILSRVSIIRGVIIVAAVLLIYVVCHRTDPGMQWIVSPLRSLGYLLIDKLKDILK